MLIVEILENIEKNKEEKKSPLIPSLRLTIDILAHLNPVFSLHVVFTQLRVSVHIRYV